MRVYVLHFLTLVAVGLSACAPSASKDGEKLRSDAPTSRISSAASDSHDFGWVPPNADLNHEFVVHNRSSDVWALVKVKTSCGCTSAVPKSTEVLPGQDVIVPVRVNSRTASGRRIQRITLSFAGNVPDKLLTVAYAIRTPVVVTPNEQYLTLIPGERKKISVTIENFSDLTWSKVDLLLHARPEHANWVSIEPVRELAVAERGINIPLQRWSVTMEIDPQELPPGEYRESIGIVAQSKNEVLKSQVLINISVTPIVRVIPESVVFVDVAPSEGYMKSLVFRFADAGRVPKAANVRLTHDFPIEMGLHCSEPSGNILKCQLSLTAATGIRGTIRGQAVIEFGEPVNQSVPVMIAVIGRHSPKPESAGPSESPE